MPLIFLKQKVGILFLFTFLVITKGEFFAQNAQLANPNVSYSSSHNELKQILEPPTYLNTGNPAVDSINYQNEKESWIAKTVEVIEYYQGAMLPEKKIAFIEALRNIDFEAARNGNFTLPIIENPYGEGTNIELH